MAIGRILQINSNNLIPVDLAREIHHGAQYQKQSDAAKKQRIILKLNNDKNESVQHR